MANVTTLKKGGTSGTVFPERPVSIVTHEIDIATAVAAGLATTELVTVATIPADTYFKLLQVEVVTALSLGANARIDLGDGTDDDEFVSNATTLTAGTNLTITKDSFTAGGTLSAADSLLLKVTGDTLASGKLRFVWMQASTERNAPTTTQD
jgi:hypothetical protein